MYFHGAPECKRESGRMYRDYVSYGLKNITKRRLRSWLTMIGIFIGIAAVVSLISLGQGLQKAIQDQFQSLGADKLIVQAKGGGFGSIGTTPSKLTKQDVEKIKRTNGVETAVGVNFNAALIEFDNEQVVYLVFGMPAEQKDQRVVEQLNAYKVIEGRDLQKSDTGKVVAGYRYAHNDVFRRNLRLGDKLTVNGKEFEIIGFMDKIGSEQDDSVLYITQNDFESLFQPGDTHDYIYVQAGTGINPADLIAPVEKSLRKSRGVKEGQEDFEVQTFQDLLNSYLTIFNIVQAVIIGIAGISLLVGAIGIMNTMYTAVLERTKEIGVMKAIGAKNSDILLIFLIESGFLGLAGGIIGILIGMGISKSVEILGTQMLGTTLLYAYFPAWLILGALAFSIIVGTLSGLLPAKQAASLQPVDALRYE
jgi:putative ABC transport system permease protein